MTRVVAFLFGLAMLVQIIRPFGIWGLHRRADAWKVAAVGLAVFALVAALKQAEQS